MNASERTLQLAREIETRLVVAHSDPEFHRLLDESRAEGFVRTTVYTVNDMRAAVMVREDAEYMRELIERCKTDRLEMITIPQGWKVEQLPVATQAKYFHYVECDGHKSMVGFQTHTELQEHLGNHAIEPTIREASE